MDFSEKATRSSTLIVSASLADGGKVKGVSGLPVNQGRATRSGETDRGECSSAGLDRVGCA
jgi:hypothetical protein